VNVRPNTGPSQVSACAAMFSEQSVVAVRKWPKDAHAVASKLGGHFTPMEEMESKDLLAHAGRLYRCQGCSRALAVIEFAALSVTQVRRHLRTAEMRLLKGELPIAVVGSDNERAVEAIVRVVTEGDPIVVADALGAIQKLPEARTYRAELLSEMRRTMRLAATMPGVAWDDVAWEVRERARREGRRVERRIVSRTLL
jgi:hypothetical protein